MSADFVAFQVALALRSVGSPDMHIEELAVTSAKAQKRDSPERTQGCHTVCRVSLDPNSLPFKKLPHKLHLQRQRRVLMLSRIHPLQLARHAQVI